MGNEREYNVRFQVAADGIRTVWADSARDAANVAFNELNELLPAWCEIILERPREADPPTMRYLLRNLERDSDGTQTLTP